MTFYIVVCFILSACVSVNSDCEHNVSLHGEGVLGEVSSFPWLGVLRVHIHNGGNFSVAITGLLLIKTNYGIASADDVIKVPKHYIKSEGKAMFIIKDHETYFCGVDDYTLHPDYEYTNPNAIALVKLDSENSSRITPICWRRYPFNTSHPMYAIGYTDQNKLLEKVIYKMEYVNDSLCSEFYNRIGFRHKGEKQSYICGYRRHNEGHCEWDNGMALASNTTGYWTLIGFGVHGPGCSAPARFIDMDPYLKWIEDMIISYLN